MYHTSMDKGKGSDQILNLYTCRIDQHWRLLKAFLHMGSSQVNPDIYLQTVKIQSHLITFFKVYFVYQFLFQ